MLMRKEPDKQAPGLANHTVPRKHNGSTPFCIHLEVVSLRYKKCASESV